MAYRGENWIGKDQRAEQAQKHTKEMERVYGEEIRASIKNTTLYDVDFRCGKTDSCETEITVEAADSVSSLMAHAKENRGRMALLNFASYKNPGGGYLGGSRAQEESLCHESCLYNVLIEFESSYYAWNNNNKNRALYLNRGLYSPDIVFCKDGTSVLCDVITCAAPNKSAARRYQKVSEEENTQVLRSRIRFVLDIARENRVDLLILGAYGCGVFGQDAKEVAGIFKEYLETTHRCFEKVVFAVPHGKDKNLEAFEAVFGRQE